MVILKEIGGKVQMASKADVDRSVTTLELARQLLDLEQRLGAYEALYEEEIGQIRRSLDAFRKQLLELLSADVALISNRPDTGELE
jgi:hypothetical protein